MATDDRDALARMILAARGKTPPQLMMQHNVGEDDSAPDPGGWHGYAAAMKDPLTPVDVARGLYQGGKEVATHPVAAAGGMMDPFGATSAAYGAFDRAFGTNSAGRLKAGQDESPLASGVGRAGSEVMALDGAGRAISPAIHELASMIASRPLASTAGISSAAAVAPDAMAGDPGENDPRVNSARQALEALKAPGDRDAFIQSHRAQRLSPDELAAKIKAADDATMATDLFKTTANGKFGPNSNRLLEQGRKPILEAQPKESLEDETGRLSRDYEDAVNSYNTQHQQALDNLQTARAKSQLDTDVSKIPGSFMGSNWAPALTYGGIVGTGVMNGLLKTVPEVAGARRLYHNWQGAVDDATAGAGSADDALAGLAKAKSYQEAYNTPATAPTMLQRMNPLRGGEGWGAIEGGIGANLPQELDVMLGGGPNPKRQAYERYLQGLPANSPDRQDAQHQLDQGDAGPLPFDNPQRAEAKKEIGDPVRTALGMFGGAALSHTTSGLAKWAKPTAEDFMKPAADMAGLEARINGRVGDITAGDTAANFKANDAANTDLALTRIKNSQTVRRAADEAPMYEEPQPGLLDRVTDLLKGNPAFRAQRAVANQNASVLRSTEPQVDAGADAIAQGELEAQRRSGGQGGSSGHGDGLQGPMDQPQGPSPAGGSGLPVPSSTSQAPLPDLSDLVAPSRDSGFRSKAPAPPPLAQSDADILAKVRQQIEGGVGRSVPGTSISGPNPDDPAAIKDTLARMLMQAGRQQ